MHTGDSALATLVVAKKKSGHVLASFFVVYKEPYLILCYCFNYVDIEQLNQLIRGLSFLFYEQVFSPAGKYGILAL